MRLFRTIARREQGEAEPEQSPNVPTHCHCPTLSSIASVPGDPSNMRHNVKRSRHTCSVNPGAILVPLMSGRFWAVAILCSVFALLHCGGTVQVTSDPARGGGAGSAGRGHAGHAGRGSSGAGSGGGGAGPDAGFDAYVDPGCPDVGAPTQVNECDPFSSAPTCHDGQGCFPFVDHPYGVGCDAQTFGTECRPAGEGQQGALCGSGDQGCASGFVCVVGSQPGKHCVQLCRIGAKNMCPPGMICGELDVEGFGVCS